MNDKNQPSNNKFVIDICCQENFTWQGTVHWVNENKKEYFRSVLEMIRLIDSALQEGEQGQK